MKTVIAVVTSLEYIQDEQSAAAVLLQLFSTRPADNVTSGMVTVQGKIKNETDTIMQEENAQATAASMMELSGAQAEATASLMELSGVQSSRVVVQVQHNVKSEDMNHHGESKWSDCHLIKTDLATSSQQPSNAQTPQAQGISQMQASDMKSLQAQAASSLMQPSGEHSPSIFKPATLQPRSGVKKRRALPISVRKPTSANAGHDAQSSDEGSLSSDESEDTEAKPGAEKTDKSGDDGDGDGDGDGDDDGDGERKPKRRKYPSASFDERFAQLSEFKRKVGHCDVPQRYAANLALGQWCSRIRHAYNKLKKGPTVDTSAYRIERLERMDFNSTELSPDRIERLEQLGFNWNAIKSSGDTAFNKRFDELSEFKTIFGHCDVPQKYTDNPGLGNWCSTVRSAHNQIQKGQKPRTNLSQDRIERLEELGFKWKIIVLTKKASFDERFDQLVEFKKQFGHCFVPSQYAENTALGHWCSNLRVAYNQLQKGQNPRTNLSADRMERLEKIGFAWQPRSADITFQKHCDELVVFNAKFGHCRVPHNYVANPALGNWCSDLRIAHNQLQTGLIPRIPRMDLGTERIERLEKIGFEWKPPETQSPKNISSTFNAAFENRFVELAEFKLKFGHCNIPNKYTENPALRNWCGNLRTAYNQLQKGQKPRMNVSAERIERLEKIGFKWKA